MVQEYVELGTFSDEDKERERPIVTVGHTPRSWIEIIVDPEMVLAIIEHLRDGGFAMTRQKFRNCLKRSIGANKEYADGCWADFQDAPIHYICSRSNLEQKYELIRTMLGESKTMTYRK